MNEFVPIPNFITRADFKDGDYCSPDSGYFVCRGGMIYWEDGEVWSVKKSREAIFRYMPVTSAPEDYSKWTKEKRDEVVKHYRVLQAEETLRIQADNDDRQRLVNSARSKLTEDEFNAMLEEGREY
jgi:hypothetical protein